MLCGGRPARVRSSTRATASRPTSGVNVSSRHGGRPAGDPGRRRDAREQERELHRRRAAADHHHVPVGEVLGEPEVVRVQLAPAEPAAAGVGGPEGLLPGAGRVDQAARPPQDRLVGPPDAAGADEEPVAVGLDALDAHGPLHAELERVLVLREVVRHGERRRLGGVADDQGHPGQLVHAVRVGHGQAGPPVLPGATGLRGVVEHDERGRRLAPSRARRPRRARRAAGGRPRRAPPARPRSRPRSRRPGSPPPPRVAPASTGGCPAGGRRAVRRSPGHPSPANVPARPGWNHPCARRAGRPRGGMGPCSTTCPRRSSSARRPVR